MGVFWERGSASEVLYAAVLNVAVLGVVSLAPSLAPGVVVLSAGRRITIEKEQYSESHKVRAA